MLSGIKFIPRDQISNEESEKRKKVGDIREKHRISDSSDDNLGRLKKRSGRKKKWYSSDEHSSEYSSDGGSEGSSDGNEKKQGNKRKSTGKNRHNSRDKDSDMSKKKSRKVEKQYFSEDNSSSASEDDGKKSRKSGKKKHKEKREKDVGSQYSEDVEIKRKEMGLDWMLRPADRLDKVPAVHSDDHPEEPPVENINNVNPRELNPYFKDNGSGYPDEDEELRVGNLPSSSVIGDGGASWRMKALKRAREQAAREGRKLEEVVGERWGSLGQLAVSAVSHTAAPARAHLRAINDRKRVQSEGQEDDQTERNVSKNVDRGYSKDASLRHSDMRAPKVRDSLSWGKRKCHVNAKDAELISAAVSSLNKFDDDGSFMSKIVSQHNQDTAGSFSSLTNHDENVQSKVTSSVSNRPTEGSSLGNEKLSANQLAAKALQLRMKGRHEEADKLMQEAESMKGKHTGEENSIRPQQVGRINRNVVQHTSTRRKEDDSDRNLAQKIMQNKQYSLSGRADDEYDFEDGPRKKSKKKGATGHDNKSSDTNILAKRILTQQERCLFCFENPNRPKHLVVSIANFTYLMLPQSQPVVPGHCCILPMQHESATRNIDNNVWEEIRNFKKCLIMMFAKQEKEVVFLETVMGLAKQRRHCLIECIPLPEKTARAAPLYFKKAIDEAEDEWSQHNAKKLIDTSEKGLRGSIPKDFPYFHVEFGLKKGFVHVIDDEQQFKSSLGLNVIRGMLQLPEEDMYRRRRQESVEAQKQAVTNFAREWEPFDWTKQLD